MAEAFLGEIRMFAGDYAPYGWAMCDGQVLPIQQYSALYSLLGAQFGGDGRTTFGLPNLRGMAPMHAGAGTGLTPRTQGQTGGAASVTLNTSHVPAHNHTYNAGTSGKGNVKPIANNVNTAAPAEKNIYGAAAGAQMNGSMLAPALSGGTHENRQPYQVLTFIIALTGYYPIRP